jgi:dihydrofolate reductase
MNMRKIILQVAVSLDGFIEGPNGEIDWCFDDGQDYGMIEFLKRVDTLFMGRKTYELTLKMGGTGFPNHTSYVFSGSLNGIEDGYRLFRGDLKMGVDEIRKSPGGDIWLFGGASLTASFMRLGLIDEIWFAVHPVLLCNGKPVFGDFSGRVNLKMLDTKPYPSGLIMVKYEIVRP